MNLIRSIFDFFNVNKKTSPIVNKNEDNNNLSKKRKKQIYYEENPKKRFKMNNSTEDNINEEIFESNEVDFDEIIILPQPKNIIPDFNETKEIYEVEDDDDVSIFLTMKDNTKNNTWAQNNTNSIDNLNLESSNEIVFNETFYDKFNINGVSEVEASQDSNEEDINFQTQFEEEEDELVDEEYEEEGEEWDEEEIEILTSIRNLFSPKINWSLLHWEQKRYQR